ncbi:hypothetical protein NT01EI_1802 [Edwardsiella ictaluri 93-146]|uniref:Uncharacterized protein n=1 Tax=Edwardsiella ictaluri (strain 93-146) TaxID=634503 RepID=C5BFL6_EDWI9|nr:hypothetical protein NT01EI_1802 [Edwardsiella ictaluri 93-146]
MTDFHFYLVMLSNTRRAQAQALGRSRVLMRILTQSLQGFNTK